MNKIVVYFTIDVIKTRFFMMKKHKRRGTTFTIAALFAIISSDIAPAHFDEIDSRYQLKSNCTGTAPQDWREGYYACDNLSYR